MTVKSEDIDDQDSGDDEEEDEDENEEDDGEDVSEEDGEESENRKSKVPKVKNSKDKKENQEENEMISGKFIKRKKNTYLSKLERKNRKIARMKNNKEERRSEYTAEKKEKAAQVSVTRILTDKDFKRIDEALAVQHVTSARKGKKRPLEEERGELVKLSDIENIHKRKRHDYEARQETVRVRIFVYLIY